jgi:N4-gp56 family major capsid protein
MSVATTYNDISQRTQAYAEGKMLEHAMPILVLDGLGESKELPKNTAKTITFRRPVPYPISLTQIQEGVTPPPGSTQFEDVSVEMGQYGGLQQLSDQVADMIEDPVLNVMSELSGEQAAETKERLLWGVLRSGTNVTYVGTGTPQGRADVNDVMNLGVQRAITRSLKNQRAHKYTRILSASPKFATEPVAASFVAVAHTDCEQDLQDMAGFTPVERYGTPQFISDNEIGKVDQFRYITSPVLVPWEGAGSSTLNGMTSVGGDNVDVYPIVFMGQRAWANVPLRGAGSMNPTVINPGKVSASDPLGQRGYVGWKMYFAALITNEAWIHRAEVGVTDL